MTPCLFVSDLHGRADRYAKLWRAIEESFPAAVFLGGDLLPSGLAALARSGPGSRDFVNDFMAPGFERLRSRSGPRYPTVFVILGNDDPRFEEAAVLDVAATGLWTYVHERMVPFAGRRVAGYAHVPPSPFLLKDWERYDVSRYVPPGSVSPEAGHRSTPVRESEIRYATIARDLERLCGSGPLDDVVFLFHTPPHDTCLDRVANDGKSVDHVPLDLHVGSIAVRRLIETRQPWITLHGHIHESVRLTGRWRERIGRTHVLGAGHDGDELALVRFDLDRPEAATRELL